MASQGRFDCVPLGDDALLVRLGDELSEELNERARSLADAVEAAKAADIFHQTLSMERTQQELDEFRGWLERSEGLSRELVQLLDKHAQGDAAAGEKAKEVAGQVKKICSECHEAYRN